MEKYSHFIRRVELLDVTLNSIQCQKVKLLEVDSGRVEVEVKSEFHLKERLQDYFSVLATFNVKCIESGGEESVDSQKEVVLYIKATFELTYNIKNFVQEDDGEMVELFTQRNVPVNIWPYGRELISSLTTRMGFPALIIGTYKTV